MRSFAQCHAARGRRHGGAGGTGDGGSSVLTGVLLSLLLPLAVDAVAAAIDGEAVTKQFCLHAPCSRCQEEMNPMAISSALSCSICGVFMDLSVSQVTLHAVFAVMCTSLNPAATYGTMFHCGRVDLVLVDLHANFGA